MTFASETAAERFDEKARAFRGAREILVRGPNWAGDLVMSTPGFRALRAAYPEARMTLQVPGGLTELIAGAPFFDEIRAVRSYHRGFPALLAEARELRSTRRYDLGICIPESFSSALLQRLAGVERIAGFGGGVRDVLLHHRVPVPPEWGKRRMVSREHFVLKLLAAIGVEAQGSELELHLTPDDESRCDELLAEHAIAETDAIVVLAPGASYGSAKRWPAQSFADVADALIDSGRRVVLVGAASESPVAHEVASAMKRKAANLVGSAGLGAAKALMRRASLVLCNDAGARHIAVAFGTPCIVFFGPTSVAKTNLNLSGVAVFETEHDCRPCYLRECPIDHRCMTQIAPADVFARASEILDA
jgi:heptosyltransferase-2